MPLNLNPAYQAERYMRALDIQLEKRPVCCICRRHIQDNEALHFQTKLEDIWLCLDCVEDNTEYIEVE